MVEHPLSKRAVMSSNPIGGFACLCRPIQCVCTSLGPTKPGRDDLDSIFQERRRKITLVGKLSKSSRRCFGNVPALAPANFSLPTAHTGSVWGCQEYRHAHFHHSSNFSLPTAHTGSVWGCQEYRHAHFHHSSSLQGWSPLVRIHISYLRHLKLTYK